MNHKSMIRVLLLVLGLGLFYFTLNAFWILNDPKTTTVSTVRNTMAAGVRSGIVDASSELLQAAAEAYQFMNEIELAEVQSLDYAAAQARIEAAIEHLQRTIWAMEWVIKRAETIGVEPDRVERLRAFDYQQLTTRFNLNSEIMTRVTAFLSQGDVIGLYRQHLANLQRIEESLLYILGEVSAKRRPANERMWTLLHQFNDSTLAANYASLVFYQE
jgi:predicted membrane metal-binding protein